MNAKYISRINLEKNTVHYNGVYSVSNFAVLNVNPLFNTLVLFDEEFEFAYTFPTGVNSQEEVVALNTLITYLRKNAIFTGSHYFGNFGANSDFDYLVVESEELNHILQQLVIYSAIVDNYNYTKIREVKKVICLRFGQFALHLQMLSTAALKTRTAMQKAIKESPSLFALYEYLPKEMRYMVWDLARELVK